MNMTANTATCEILRPLKEICNKLEEVEKIIDELFKEKSDIMVALEYYWDEESDEPEKITKIMRKVERMRKLLREIMISLRCRPCEEELLSMLNVESS